MNIKTTITISAIALFALSCQPAKEDKYNVQNIKIPFEKTNDTIRLSKYFKNIEFLPLETKNNCMIGEISKVKISQNYIYILDRVGNSLLVFNTNGKFEKKISSIGAGPDEYVKLMDFDVEDGNIFLLDMLSKKVLHYNDFKFINSSKINFLATEICIIPNGLLFKNLSFSAMYDRFITTTLDLKIKTKLLSVFNTKTNSTKYNWLSNTTFAKNKSEIYFSPTYNDSIFELDNKDFTIKETKVFDFGTKKLPKNDNINNYNMGDLDFKYIVLNSFFINNTFLIASYLNHNSPFYVWINNKEHTLDHGFAFNDINKIPFFPKWSYDKGLIGSVSTSMLLENDSKDLLHSNKNISTIKLDDNPVLTLYLYK